jgi:hypothetical protein
MDGLSHLPRLSFLGLLWASGLLAQKGVHCPVGALRHYQEFCAWQMVDPHISFREPGAFESQCFALHRLYDLRLQADYRLDDISQEEAQCAIQTAQEIIAIAEQKDARDAT